MKFYNQAKLDQIYTSMKQKRYSEKEPWEKFITNQASKKRKKEKRQRENEWLTDTIDLF